MGKYWSCGDCGAEYHKSVRHCTRYLDDYLSLRGGSIESAIQRSIAPFMRKFDRLIEQLEGGAR